MEPKPKHDLEKALFTSAVDGLNIARHRGIEDKTGLDALVAAMYIRRPRIYAERLMRDSAEIAEYIQNLGGAVEMAAERSNLIDQQR